LTLGIVDHSPKRDLGRRFFKISTATEKLKTEERKKREEKEKKKRRKREEKEKKKRRRKRAPP
jgi:hypothetical protein